MELPIIAMDDNTPVIPRLDRLKATAGSTGLRTESQTLAPPHGRVLVMIDVSESQTQRFTKPLLKEALNQFLNRIPASTDFGALFFDESLQARVDFTQDRRILMETLTAQLEKPWRRKSAIFDAIHAAVQMFGGIQPGDSIVLFTDGEDNASNIRIKDLKEIIRRTGIRIFAAYLPLTWSPDLIAPPRHTTRSQELANLSSWSGGVTVSPTFNDFSGAGLMRGVELLGVLIANTTFLRIQVPEKLASTKLKLRSQDKAVRLFHPEHLPDCIQKFP